MIGNSISIIAKNQVDFRIFFAKIRNNVKLIGQETGEYPVLQGMAARLGAIFLPVKPGNEVIKSQGRGCLP